MSVLNRQFNQTSSCLGLQCDVINYNSDDLLRIRNIHNTLTIEDQQTKDEIDAMLSQAMSGLAFEERQVQQEALHGVDENLAEEEALIESALQELDSHLSSLKQGTMYETAESLDGDYVRERAFRVMFLRGKRYDAKAAADQILRFFEIKHELFGMEKLVKEITIGDLDDDDLASLKTGFAQLAGRDRSNRQVIIQIPGLRSFKTITNELRSLFFMTMRALKSEVTQLRGFVSILYSIGEFREKKPQARDYWDNARVSMALPVYIAGNHMVFGHDDMASYVLCNLAVKAMPVQLRARNRVHFGSDIECQYRLSTFGVLPSLLPFTLPSNEINLTRHLQWFQSCLDNRYGAQYGENQSPTVVTKISPNDVLSTGFKRSDNLGNQRLRGLIRELSQAYDSGTKENKRTVVDRIIDEIHGFGGRFLKEVKGQPQLWEELEQQDEVRQKITQMFRNSRRKRETIQQDIIDSADRITGEPLPEDVLFGRTQRSAGNDLLHRLVKDRSQEYESLDRKQKMVIVYDIINQIKSDGGRFLQPSKAGDLWFEVSDEVARTRITKYFQNNRRGTKKSR